MSKNLPCRDFHWATGNECEEMFETYYHNLQKNGTASLEMCGTTAQYNGTFMVDLEYPRKFHKLHDDYPLAPIHRACGESGMIKLCGTLEDKHEFCIAIL